MQIFTSTFLIGDVTFCRRICLANSLKKMYNSYIQLLLDIIEILEKMVVLRWNIILFFRKHSSLVPLYSSWTVIKYMENSCNWGLWTMMLEKTPYFHLAIKNWGLIMVVSRGVIIIIKATYLNLSPPMAFMLFFLRLISHE